MRRDYMKLGVSDAYIWNCFNRGAEAWSTTRSWLARSLEDQPALLRALNIVAIDFAASMV